MKEYELKLMNEKTKKKINIHFKDTRVTFIFEDGTKVEVMEEFVNNFLKGYKIIGCDVII